MEEIRRREAERHGVLPLDDRTLEELDIDLARAVQADGVHLGQDDLPVAAARESFGSRLLIGASARNVREALDHNPKIIVVDPRETELARRAEVWLQLRPGTDDALALAMIQVIIAEHLYDGGRVDGRRPRGDPRRGSR